MFKNYIKYIKDNPEGYWFKRKLYGWGWMPAKWQGWLVMLVFLLFVIFQIMLFRLTAQTNRDVALFLANIFFSVIALLLICKITGEKLKWQWGIPKKEELK